MNRTGSGPVYSSYSLRLTRAGMILRLAGGPAFTVTSWADVCSVLDGYGWPPAG